MLSGWLDWLQRSVHIKCRGLSDEQAHATPLSTSPRMSMAAVVSHLTAVEKGWLQHSFLGERNTAASPTKEDAWAVEGRHIGEILAEYGARNVRSQEILTIHELDDFEAYAPAGAEIVTLRWIVNHLVEETARHLGHLDILREMADGTRGH